MAVFFLERTALQNKHAYHAAAVGPCRLYLAQAEVEADRNRWVSAALLALSVPGLSVARTLSCLPACLTHDHWMSAAPWASARERHAVLCCPVLSAEACLQHCLLPGCAHCWLNKRPGFILPPQPEVLDLSRKAATAASESDPGTPEGALLVSEVGAVQIGKN